MKKTTFIIVLMSVLLTAGCALTDAEREQIGAAAAQTQTVIAETEAIKGQLVESLPALKAAGLLTPEKEQQVQALVGQLDEKIVQAKQALTTFQVQLQSNPDADGLDVGIAAVQSAAPMFGSYGALLGALAGLAGFARAAYNRSAGRKLATAIETAKAKGAVNFSDPETAAKLSAAMGAAAKAIVDEAQGKATVLPI